LWKYERGCFNGENEMRSVMAKFVLGEIVVTTGVLQAVPELDQFVALNRHAQCDWGDISEDDKLANENGLKHKERLMSVFFGHNGIKFWIITEADRSCTTLLLPEEM
jgi:hypothetical protein